MPLSPVRERTDIIVDFSKFAGHKIVMTNTAGGMKYDLKYIMQFRGRHAFEDTEVEQ